MLSTARFGLLIDVDGPISNPDAKAITEPTIVPSLVALLARGVPVVLNTGRSYAFAHSQVLQPLLDAGAAPLELLHSMCEKGAVSVSWADGRFVEDIDDAFQMPPDVQEGIRKLVEERFSHAVFYDDTKEAMVSIERRPDVSHDDYVKVQPEFDAAAFDLITELGHGVRLRDRVAPDDRGEVPYRIDPSIIATDIEPIVLGKALGAERALQLLAGEGELPSKWRTLGDSSTDYAMAEWLHDNGYEVAHVDVRDASHESAPEPFPVIRPTRTNLDDAGAAYLRWVLADLDGDAPDESSFDA